MKIIKIDYKNNELKIVPNSLDDLWHLEKIIEIGDLVSGKTDRKIKPKKEGEKTIRETLFVEIKVEDVKFQEFSGNLKINGVIVGGRPEELVELKSYQSLDVVPGNLIKIKKNSIKKWQIERLKKAERESASSGLLVALMDDEECSLAFVNQFSIKVRAKIVSKKQGKMFKEEKGKYFDEILSKLMELKPKKVLVAGPGFTRENFTKFLWEKKQKGFPQVFVESASSVGETGFEELLKSGKLEKLEKELQLSSESKLVEEFLKKVSKGLGEYGKEKVLELINLGAVGKLIVGETVLLENRSENEELMDLAEKNGSEVHIISSKNPLEKKIHGFGGIVVILRYKV